MERVFQCHMKVGKLLNKIEDNRYVYISSTQDRMTILTMGVGRFEHRMEAYSHNFDHLQEGGFYPESAPSPTADFSDRYRYFILSSRKITSHNEGCKAF